VFIVGTKFGNIYETSFRFYNTNDLSEEDKWPENANGLHQQDLPFDFAGNA